MKKLFLLLCIGVLTFSVNAQITTPQPSPTSKLEQKVGLTDVTIEYSRPSMKGRAIFGDLVPFDAMWRFGANKNTTITIVIKKSLFDNFNNMNKKKLKFNSKMIFF